MEWKLRKYAPRIADFFRSLPVTSGTVRFLWGRYRFSRGIDRSLHQRIRNFLYADCPLPG